MAGCDFSDKEFLDNIPAAVRDGKLTEARLDDALTRVLRVRMRLGEFDPFTSGPIPEFPPAVIISSAHRAVALKTAQESIVLLQNRGELLPLDKSTLKRIAVIGPLADRIVLNNYNGKPDRLVTPLQGIKDQASTNTEVLYAPGGVISNPGPKDKPFDQAAELEKAVALAKSADVAVVFVGTDQRIEQEGRNMQSIRLYWQSGSLG